MGQLWIAEPRLPEGQRWDMKLPDGDRIVATFNPAARDRPDKKRRVVVIVHGLGGHQNLFHIQRLAESLLARGFGVLRVNMRGCGKSRGLSKRPIRGANSDDLAIVVQTLRERWGDGSIDLLGFSFGGNTVLRYAGMASKGNYPEVQRCFAVSAPVDLVANAQKIQRVFPGFLKRRVIRRFVDNVDSLYRRYPDLGAPPSWPTPIELEDIERLYLQPQMGLETGQSYLQAMSCAPVLADIKIPTTMIWAQDDPVIDVEAIQNYPCSPQLRCFYCEYGGHVGFYRPFSAPPQRWWLDEQLLGWLEATSQGEGRI